MISSNSKIYHSENSCEEYGGIGKKWQNFMICCQERCGKCGGSGCSKRPGGKRNCCSHDKEKLIIKELCGKNSRKAPCRFKIGELFYPINSQKL